MDGNWVRRCAGEVGELSEQVRAVAVGLGAARADSWHSLAAQEYRDTLEQQQRSLAATQEALDDARGALETHARAMDDVLAGPLGGLAGELLGLHR